MARTVREPIQVYLSQEERDRLDREAARLGVSRSEALRRGLLALASHQYVGPSAALADAGYLTPPTNPSSEPPPRHPVSTLDEVLAGLADDRADRFPLTPEEGADDAGKGSG